MEYWVKRIKIKKGALSKQLGIPVGKRIPLSLLKKIQAARVGKIIRNPTKIGYKRIKITPKLERRAILAIRLKAMKKR